MRSPRARAAPTSRSKHFATFDRIAPGHGQFSGWPRPPLRTLIADAGFPQGIAIDPTTALLYFTDNVTDTITRMSLDGSAPVVVYQNPDPLSNPYGVTIAK
jgi:hypothetical protein